jgi:hypothetical protein
VSEDPAPDSPWRLLVLDRSDPGDPRWLLATVTRGADVRPAVLDDVGRYTDWYEVTQWVRDSLGRSEVSLVPVPIPLVWRVDEGHGGEG